MHRSGRVVHAEGSALMRSALCLTCAAMIFALAIHAIASIAPRVSPEVAQQQRVTAPWLSGERLR